MAFALWERTTLESFFQTNWAHTPIKWEATSFTPPKSNGTFLSYVAFLLRGGTGVPVSLGSKLLQRQVSMVVLQMFTPELSGRKDHLTYIDYALDIWVPRDFTDGNNVIRTRPAYANTVGINKGWLQSNVFVPYILDTPTPNH